ncbi:MAG: DUF4129 domain-containing protein [Pirellulaceae bacterium]
MDYMVIGISPALIMAMVGSLLFYLLTVFYHGQYESRLAFIFAMFVIAIVLIARISMEEGVEYASLFAIPLAIVTMLAMMKFVQIQGPLASYSTIINVGLIALVWWSAHQLTWDCTFIDENQDSSGEGLLQGMGFTADSVESQAAEQLDDSSPESKDVDKRADERNAETRDQSGWWQRLLDRRHRSHAPGVWVICYAIAALPLFGLGQWLIPASDAAARLHAFHLLVIYVASAMGLLLTCSFLGLRRYLRQRKMEMPTEMAGIWLGIGATMILALVLFCMLLPRPGAVVAVSQLPFSFSSPKQSRAHRHAMGNDGPEQPEKATRTRPDAKESGANAGVQEEGTDQPSPHSERKPAGRSTGKQAEQNGRQGESASSQARQSTGANDAPGRAQNKNGSDASPNPSQLEDRAGGKSPDGSPARSGKSPNGAAEERQGQAGSAGAESGTRDHAAKTESEKRAPSPGQPPRSSASRDREEGRRQDQSTTTRESQSKPRRPSGTEPKEKPEQQPEQPDSGKSRADGGSSFSDSSNTDSFSITSAISGFLGGLAGLLKVLFWLVLMVIFAYLAWKYRDQIMQAIRQLIADLRDLWSRFFGANRTREEVEKSQASGTETPSFKSFASYHDPFISGGAERYSTEQLVRYTFEAMEAWAREHACPRDEEHTPLEFARHVAVEHPNLGIQAQQLADLYSRVAYGRERIASDARNVLRQLWGHMRSAAAVPPPPPPGMMKSSRSSTRM